MLYTIITYMSEVYCSRIYYYTKIEIEKDFGYRRGVLVGDWLDRRYNFKKENFDILPTPLSTYKQDFKPNFQMPDRSEMHKNFKHNWGNPLLKLCVPDEEEGGKENYCRGFVTLNDLVYHHHIRNTVNAEYGNLTKIGISDEKEKEWADQKRLNTYETSYKFYFHEHPRECLQTEHIRQDRCLKKGHDHKRQRICCFMPHTPKSILPSL